MFSNDAQVGIAVQSAKGTAATNPTVASPVQSGLPEWRQNDEPTNPAHQRLAPQFITKGGIWWEADIATIAWPASLGGYLKALLGAESGTGGTHTITPDTTVDRWVTLFSKRPGPLYERFSDGLIESVQVTWRSGEPVTMAIRAQGLSPEVRASAYTPGFTDTPDTNWLSYIQGTVTTSWAGGAAAEIGRYVEGGTVTISRPLSMHQSYKAQKPIGFTRHVLTVHCSLDLWWENYDAYRAGFTASTSGSLPSASIAYGSLSTYFADVKDNANRSLALTVPNVRWKVPTLGPDPARGQPLRGQVEGVAVRSASQLITATVRNALTAAY